MFFDSTTLPENTVIEADICIIGAGAAGITLARDLAGGNRRIAVFESGGFDFSQETQQLYDGEVVGQPFTPINADRLRFFGGTTNHWSGSCRPFDEADFEGWPFERSALEPYYRRAQDICQLGPYTYAPEDWMTEETPPLDFGPQARFRSGVFQFSPPTRFGPVYRQDLEAASNISVYLNANLVTIETNDNASEVTGLGFACLNGPRFRAHARHYVLATGGIENPRILLNANHVQKQGLGNQFDLVGRYFMDHASINNSAMLLFKEPHPKLGFYDLNPVRGQRAMGYVYPTPELRHEEGLPPFNITITPGSPPDTYFSKASLLTVYRTLLSGHWPDHIGFHLEKIFAAVELRAPQMYQRVTHTTPQGFSTAYMVGCPPDPESRVALIDTVDALGLRRVELDWRLPPDFEKTMLRAHELLGQELGRNGLGRLRMNSSATMQNVVNAHHHHHMGTTRMHTNPREGVVDENCRIHGIANLFVAGSSVFPTYSFDDPTMTIVALSLRLSEHLKSLAS
jgi:choline dehydrogenase-like flavoprotein